MTSSSPRQRGELGSYSSPHWWTCKELPAPLFRAGSLYPVSGPGCQIGTISRTPCGDSSKCDGPDSLRHPGRLDSLSLNRPKCQQPVRRSPIGIAPVAGVTGNGPNPADLTPAIEQPVAKGSA